eukprot:gene1542-1680_t
MPRVDDLLLAFVPESTAERWLLARHADEISLVLSEVYEIYSSLSTIEKLNVEEVRLRHVVELVLENITTSTDSNLRLNGFRLLRGLCEQHSQEFLSLADQVFACVKVGFHDVNKIVKESALRFAALWFSLISFQVSSLFLCKTLEGSTAFSEVMLNLANIAVLQSLVEISHQPLDSEPSSSFQTALIFLSKYALGIILRLQNSVSLSAIDVPQDGRSLSSEEDWIAASSGSSRKIAHDTAKATHAVLQAAIDLLGYCSISLYALECALNGRRFQISLCRANPTVVLFFNSDALDLSSLSRSIEQELIKRIRTLSFPSLMQGSTFTVAEDLMESLRNVREDVIEQNSPTHATSLQPKTTVSPSAQTGLMSMGMMAVKTSTSSCADSPPPGPSPPSDELNKEKKIPAPLLNSKSRSKSSDLSQRLNYHRTEEESSTLSHSVTTPSLIDMVQNPLMNGIPEGSGPQPTQVSEVSRNSPPPTLRSQTFDRQKLRALKQTQMRPNSYSSGMILSQLSEKADLDETNGYMTPEKGRSELSPTLSNGAAESSAIAQSAFGDSLHAKSLDNYEQENHRSITSKNIESSPPMEIALESLRSPLKINMDNLNSPAMTSSPMTCSANDGYMRAASARVKRSRLKNLNTPTHSLAHMEPLQSALLQSSNHLPFPSPAAAVLNKSLAEGNGDMGYSVSQSSREGGSAASVSMKSDGMDEIHSHAGHFSRTPSSAKLSMLSPNVKNREIRNANNNGSNIGGRAKIAPLVRQQSDHSSITYNSFDLDVSSVTEPMQDCHLNSSSSSISNNQKLIDSVPSGDEGVDSSAAVVLLGAGKADAFEYTASADLQPLPHPSADLTAAMKGLETQEWPDIFHTLNIIRRAVLHHSPIVLQSGCLHRLIQLVVKLVGNLRSSVAKNALMTVSDCFQGLKKAMDPEAGLVVPAVLKRCADSSNFLSESAEQALFQMVQNASPGRSLQALLQGVDHKNSSVRAKATAALVILIQQYGGDLELSRDLDMLKSRLNKLLQDSSPETRSNGREIVRILLHSVRISRYDMESFVKSDLLDKAVKEAVNPGGNSYYNLRTLMDHNEEDGHRGNATQSPLRPASHLPRLLKPKNAAPIVSNGVETPPRNLRYLQEEDALLPQLLSPGSSVLYDESESNGSGGEEIGELSSHKLSMIPTPHHAAPNGRERVIRSALAGHNNTPKKSTTATRVIVSASRNGRDNSVSSVNSSYAAKRMMESDSELIHWNDLQIKVSSVKGLQERKEVMTSLTSLIMKHASVLKDAGKLEASLDSLLDRLEEGSIKIVQHAMDCLEQIQSHDSMILQNVGLQVISPKLLNAVGSSNRLISQRAVALLYRVYRGMASTHAATYLSHVIEHEKDKLRIAALRVATEMASNLADDFDYLHSVVKRTMFPSVLKVFCTEVSKAELRVACADYFKALQSKLLRCPGGVKIYLWTDSPKEQEDIKRITGFS